MDSQDDASVIQSALAAHLPLMRAAEDAHRSAARAVPAHPELQRTAPEAIMLSAAHRARSAGYAQRADFLEELGRFPAIGLRALTQHDMRTLRVPGHIGAAAAPQLAGQPPLPPLPALDHRRAAVRARSTNPAASGRSFEDIIYGRGG